MKNVYTVKLGKPVEIGNGSPHFGSKQTQHLYVIASSFANAQDAVLKKHPGVEIRGIDLLNYSGVPIVVGE